MCGWVGGVGVGGCSMSGHSPDGGLGFETGRYQSSLDTAATSASNIGNKNNC